MGIKKPARYGLAGSGRIAIVLIIGMDFKGGVFPQSLPVPSPYRASANIILSFAERNSSSLKPSLSILS